MKVLWFTNTPCSAAELLHSGSNRGGWLQALEQQLVLNEQVDLHIAFYFSKALETFSHKKTTYHPVQRKNTGTKTGRWMNRMIGKTAGDSSEVQQLLAVIKTVQPDIIHIHGTEENFGLVACLANIPVVISMQGILTPYAEKYFTGIPQKVAIKNEGIKQKILFNSVVNLYSDLSNRAARERAMLAGIGNVMGRTGWDRKVTSMLAPAARYFHCGEILREGFYNNMWQKDVFNKKIRIVSVSSEALYKGFEMIAKTAIILAAREGFDFEWIVAGLSRENASVQIVKKWLNTNLDDINVSLVGNRTEEEVIALLLSADVFCQVSHIENSPNSLCEAMLLGMPVIANYAGGTPSLVTDGEDGLLVQDGDAWSLAGAVVEMVTDFGRAKKLGTNARSRAAVRHNAVQITDELFKNYNTILSPNR